MHWVYCKEDVRRERMQMMQKNKVGGVAGQQKVRGSRKGKKRREIDNAHKEQQDARGNKEDAEGKSRRRHRKTQ